MLKFKCFLNIKACLNTSKSRKKRPKHRYEGKRMQQNLNAKYIKFLSDDEGKSKILASELNVPQAEFDAVWSWFLLLLQRQSKLDVFGDDVIKDLASRLETLAANLSQSAQNFVLAKLIYYNNIIQSGHLDSAVCGIMSKFYTTR